MRTTKEVKYLKYEFDSTEKLEMGNTLASNHNRLADLKAQEAVFKAQMKDKVASIELSIQGLSRNISMGFEMRNIECAVKWDSPNINEVEYVRLDTGEVAITRAMTDEERQQELDFGKMVEAEAGKIVTLETASADASTENIETFFGKPRLAPEPELELAPENPEPDEDDEELETDEATAEDAGNSAVVDAEEELFASTDPTAAAEAIKPEHDAAWEGKKPTTRKKAAAKPKDEEEPF